MSDMPMLDDLQLLELEMDLLWGAQAGPELVLACAREGVRARLGNHVPPELARALAAEIDGAQLGPWVMAARASASCRSAIRRCPTHAPRKRESGHIRSAAGKGTRRRRPRHGRRSCGQVVACCSTALRG